MPTSSSYKPKTLGEFPKSPRTRTTPRTTQSPLTSGKNQTLRPVGEDSESCSDPDFLLSSETPFTRANRNEQNSDTFEFSDLSADIQTERKKRHKNKDPKSCVADSNMSAVPKKLGGKRSTQTDSSQKVLSQQTTGQPTRTAHRRKHRCCAVN